MMSHSASQSLSMSTDMPSATSYGQVIEYIQGTTAQHITTITNGRSFARIIANMQILHYSDRLYLASYTHTPDENTPFPYPAKPAGRSPHKRSSRAQAGPQAVLDGPRVVPTYFSIDRSLLYNAFHADFGPLHVGHLYRFAVQLHDVLGSQENESRPVVFWSHSDSRSEFAKHCDIVSY
jgi:cell division cycle 14